MRKNIIAIELSIPANTLPSAPVSRIVTNSGAPYLAGIYAYSTDAGTLGKVYFRLVTQRGVLFPAFTTAPIDATIPAGWVGFPDKAYFDVLLALSEPERRLEAQFINTHSAAYSVHVHLVVSDEPELSLLDDIAHIVRQYYMRDLIK